MNSSIGRIIEVSTSYIRIEIGDLKFLSYNLDGQSYDSKGINEYISVDGKFGDIFIFQTIRAEDSERQLSNDENSKFSNSAVITCIPIGILTQTGIEFNLHYYPFLNDEVYLTTHKQLKSIFSAQSTNKNLHLGSTVEGFIPDISLESYITKHTAILGNTGSGKSTTIRKSIEQIHKLKPSNLYYHILDVHGEYEPSDTIGYKKYDVKTEYKILMSSLNLNDWTNLFKPSEQVQLPILQLTLKLSNLIAKYPWFEAWMHLYLSFSLYNKIQTDVVGKRAKIGRLISDYCDIVNSFEKNQNFTAIEDNLNRLIRDIENYNIQYGNFRSPDQERNFLNNLKTGMSILWEKSGNYPEESFNNLIKYASYSASSFHDILNALEFAYLAEESKGNSQARSYSASLETRIKTVSVRFDSLFTSDPTNEPSLIPDEKYIIYNVENLDDDLMLFFSSYLINKFFESQRDLPSDERNIHVFLLEEAHRYISRNLETTSSHQIDLFKKIAREGRKFGCFLQISSQRPSEISATILSQCNNFIIHRIKNNIDLDYMSSTIPYLTRNQLERVSYLPTGTALFVGDLFPIPIEISVFSSKMYNDTNSPIIKYDL